VGFFQLVYSSRYPVSGDRRFACPNYETAGIGKYG
jgi:hypothetical protein